MNKNPKKKKTNHKNHAPSNKSHRFVQKSSSGDGKHKTKTEKRATETWGFQILPTLYSSYQKVFCPLMNVYNTLSLFSIISIKFCLCHNLCLHFSKFQLSFFEISIHCFLFMFSLQNTKKKNQLKILFLHSIEFYINKYIKTLLTLAYKLRQRLAFLHVLYIFNLCFCHTFCGYICKLQKVWLLRGKMYTALRFLRHFPFIPLYIIILYCVDLVFSVSYYFSVSLWFFLLRWFQDIYIYEWLSDDKRFILWLNSKPFYVRTATLTNANRIWLHLLFTFSFTFAELFHMNTHTHRNQNCFEGIKLLHANWLLTF